MTKEDKAEWDRMWDQVEECDRSIRELTEDLRQRRNQQIRKFIEEDIAHEKRLREIIVDAVGEPMRRGPSVHGSSLSSLA